MNTKLPPLNLYPTPRRLYTILVAAGVLLGMTLAQLIFFFAGMVPFSPTLVGTGLVAAFLLVQGWRTLSSLPWSVINDPVRLEHQQYRSPYAPLANAGDRGEKDVGSIPSPTPAAAPEDLEG